MPRQRRQFARIGAFIEREEDDRQPRLVPEPVEQRFERLHIVGARGDIRPHVAAEVREQLVVMVAEAAGVDLHHQAIVHAHRRHFGEHLRAKQFGIGGGGAPVLHALEQGRRIGIGQIGSCRGGVAVIGRGRPHRSEVFAPLAVRGEIARP